MDEKFDQSTPFIRYSKEVAVFWREEYKFLETKMRNWMNIIESSKTFHNELNNKITVKITEKDIDGVAGVMIYISGPTSETENHITRMEAKEIYVQLKDLFDKE